MWVKETLAIAGKELRTEWRSRVALASLGLFVACSIALVALSTARIPLNGEGGKEIGSQIAAALIWIQVCFASAMGLGRAFVVESERGTMTALRLHTRATAVWAGKFIGNTLLLLGVCVITVPMTCGVLGVTVKHPFALIAVVMLAAIGMGAVFTTTGALVAQTSARGGLLAALSFPVLLPAFVSGVDGTLRAIGWRLSASSAFLDTSGGILVQLLSYAVLAIAASLLLFDAIWND